MDHNVGKPLGIVLLLGLVWVGGCQDPRGDQNDCEDLDGDGYGSGAGCLGADCREGDAQCYEGACCDMADCADPDGDGYGGGEGCLGPDCAEGDASCHQGACCDVTDCDDPDGDGYGAGDDCLGPDCAPGDPTCHEADCCDLGYGNVLYLNFNGGALSESFFDDAPTNLSLAGDRDPKHVPGLMGDFFFDGSITSRQAVIDDIAQRVQALYAPFDVQVVTRRPPLEHYTMVVVGGTRADIVADAIACEYYGLATVDCDNDDTNNVGYAHSACLREYAALQGEPARVSLTRTIAHEAAHTYGLVHAGAGIMAEGHDWGSGAVDQSGDSLTCGRTTQDDVALLTQHLGLAQPRLAVPPPPDLEPPIVSDVLPADGAALPSGSSICLNATDPSGVQLVALQVFIEDPNTGMQLLVETVGLGSPPYEFHNVYVAESTTFNTLYRLVVLDQWDNLTEHRISATYDPNAPAVQCP